MDLSKLGVFCFLDGLSGEQVGQFVRKVERLGYSAMWVAETTGRESFSLASYLLSQTEKLIVATGVAVVFKREPVTTWGAAKTLAELFEDRFILGLGVSAQGINTRRGIPYEKPYSFMQDYLAKMKVLPYNAPVTQQDPPIVLAALRPKMVQLAAIQTHGNIRTLCRRSKPPSHVQRSALTNGCVLNRPCCSKRIQLRHEQPPGSTSPPTSVAGIIRSFCSPSASPMQTSPRAIATDWSMRSWPGGMKTRYVNGSLLTIQPGRHMYVSCR